MNDEIVIRENDFIIMHNYINPKRYEVIHRGIPTLSAIGTNLIDHLRLLVEKEEHSNLWYINREGFLRKVNHWLENKQCAQRN